MGVVGRLYLPLGLSVSRFLMAKEVERVQNLLDPVDYNVIDRVWNRDFVRRNGVVGVGRGEYIWNIGLQHPLCVG